MKRKDKTTTRREMKDLQLCRLWEEGEGHFACLAEQAADAFLWHDQDGRIVVVNQQACESLGYTRDELLTMRLQDIEASLAPQALKEIWDSLEQDRPVTVQGVHRRRDGTTFPVEMRVGLFRTMGRPFILSLVRDVSERLRAEEDIAERIRHAALGAEVGAALTKGASLAVALQGCTEAMVSHLDGAFARIWTIDGPKEALALQASAGMYTHTDGPHGRIPLGQGKVGQIALEAKSHLTNAVVGDPGILDQEWARREGMVAFAGLPLVVEGKVVGVAALFSRQALSVTALHALEAVADEIAIGIERFRTERALRESEARFRGLVEESLLGAYMIQGGRLIYYNRRYAEIFGYTKEEIGGLGNVLNLVYPEDRDLVAGVLEKRSTGEIRTIQYQYRGLRKDGTTVHLEVVGWETDYEGQPAMLGKLMDITDRKRAEEERLAFFNMLTHDIKNPLSIIYGYSDHHSQKEAGPAGPLLERIHQAARSISRLINDMLELSRLEAGKVPLQREAVSVQSLLLQAVKGHEVAARERDVILEIGESPPLEVYGDLWHLGRALSNLVANAVSYNRPGGRITIRAGRNGEGVYLEVADTGEGIAAEDLPHIFDKYYRGRTPNGIKGTGLGLAIVKAVVEAHGGRIGVTSRLGEGTTFKIVLPDGATSSIASYEGGTPPGPGR